MSFNLIEKVSTRLSDDFHAHLKGVWMISQASFDESSISERTRIDTSFKYSISWHIQCAVLESFKDLAERVHSMYFNDPSMTLEVVF
jgi:hypothetical protein